jgi:serine/threonine protein kinase
MPERQTLLGFFKALLSEQIISRAVECSVGAVLAGPVGAVAVPVLSKAIEYYGVPMAENLLEWVRQMPPADACTVLADVANLPAQEALNLAGVAVSQAMPDASEINQAQLISYLAGVSASLRQSLPRGDNGLSTCPAALLPRTQEQALRMLPVHLPPFLAPCDLPGTDYRLVRLLGTGGFGAVYEARLRSEPLIPRVLKFCLDPERVDVLRHERRSFERILESTCQGEWPRGIVRLLGDNLSYERPFLVFEYVPDGDLSVYVENHRLLTGRSLNPDEVLFLIERIARAVTELHSVGLTHCDLKPANILFSRGEPYVADLGLGAVAPQWTGNLSRQKTRTATALDLRGAGTYLYSAPEQWRGAAPKPPQDIYSLGVIWYQLLIEDFTRAPGTSWRKQLASRGVPEKHLALLEMCLEEEPSERPANGQELVDRLKGETTSRIPVLAPKAKSLPNQHKHIKETSQEVAQQLRNTLLNDLSNTPLREQYLNQRSSELAQVDQVSAFHWKFWMLLAGALAVALFLVINLSRLAVVPFSEMGPALLAMLIFGPLISGTLVTMAAKRIDSMVLSGNMPQAFVPHRFWVEWGVAVFMCACSIFLFGTMFCFILNMLGFNEFFAFRLVMSVAILLSLNWLILFYWPTLRFTRWVGLPLSETASQLFVIVGLVSTFTPILFLGFGFFLSLFSRSIFFDWVLDSYEGLTRFGLSGFEMWIVFHSLLFFAGLMLGFWVLFRISNAASLREKYGPLPPAILDEDTCQRFLDANR